MLELYFFNVGHGDSIAIKFPNEEWGVIDCNRNKREHEPNVLKFLIANNVERLKFLAVTHYHDDHCKGVDVIAEHYKENIDNLILPTVHPSSKLGYKNKSDFDNLTYIVKAIKTIVTPQQSQRLYTIEDGNEYNVGDVTISFINPNRDIVKECLVKYYNDAEKTIFNKESLVMTFNYAGRQILLTGDVTRDVWENIFEQHGEISADIIKISHHGSIENNSAELLQILTANSLVSVVSSDGNSRYKSLPAEEVIDFLENKDNHTTLRTYDLNQNFVDINQNTRNLSGNKVIDGINKNKSIINYDGYFKITIDENGHIEINRFQHI